jgi:hypothetical protein
MRVVDDGSEESGVEVRMVIQSVEEVCLFGKVMGPTNSAPASSCIVSPGRAAFRAACRSPPAGTVIVSALAVRALPARSAAERTEKKRSEEARRTKR